MPALPTTGEIRFSAIGTEFSDPYSLTDSTKTIRLSHYYTNIPIVGGNDGIDTTHLATDANPPVQDPFPISFNPFSLELFRGKERFIEDSGGGGGGGGGEENPWDTKLTANLISYRNARGSGGVTYYEILSGVKGENLDREVDKGGLGFDNLGTHAYSPAPSHNDANNQHYYPNLVLQGTTSDSIKITARISKRSRFDEHIVKFWVYKVFNDTGWGSPRFTTDRGTATTLTYTFDIPEDVSPGAYAIGVSIEYATSGNYRSWKSYSFHIW
tara:strand:+ start:60 stop:869 length:810 start_codon:yes stop_codon:yes gene_type:complete